MKTPTFEEMTTLVEMPHYKGWVSKEDKRYIGGYDVRLPQTKEQYDKLIADGFVDCDLTAK